jgi:NAD-dependent SIR2 family protein deacetylase
MTRTNLYHLHGYWIVTCRTCGVELARDRVQYRAERAGMRQPCPICR